MPAPAEILVATDLTLANQRACDVAVELASALGAHLTLLTVLEPAPYWLPEQAAFALAEDTTAKLVRLAETLQPYARGIETVMVTGVAWEQIDRVAVERGAGLVIVGTYGRRGFSRAVLGSVAERVVRTSSVPVMTVPSWVFASRAQAARQLGPALAEMPEGATVLALSRGALPFAAAAAEALHGSLGTWLTAPVIVGGSVVGAVGELGAPLLEGAPAKRTARARGAPADAADAVGAARAAIESERRDIGDGRAAGEIRGRAVLLVADGLTTTAPVLAAARALVPLSPREVSGVAGVATHAVVSAASRELDRFVALETVIAQTDPALWFRDDAVPSRRAARHLLASKPGERTRAHHS